MDHRYTKFLNATSAELAADESFQAFVFRENSADIDFWEGFLRLHPEKQRDVDEAVEMLNWMSFRKVKAPAAERSRQLEKLLASAGETTPEVARPARSVVFTPSVYRVAASLGGLIILVCAAYYSSRSFFTNDMVIRQTAYGENVTFVLPDSSTVVLNGNTRLLYRRDWDDGHAREVWLEGEAFFDVRHKGSDAHNRFIVHIPQLSVEVLGTRFNVFNRDHKANVVLNSGKVKLNINNDYDTSTVVLMPNQAVEYSRKDHTIVKRHVNAETLTSWRNRVWIFDHTPLVTIAEMIEYNFGVKTTFAENVDPREELVGTIPSENLDVLLTVLSKTSGLQVTRDGQQIHIEKKDPPSIQP